MIRSNISNIVFRPLIVLACFFLLISTTALGAGDKKNSKAGNNPYKKDAIFLHPSYKVFHDADRSSKLFFSINNKFLLYTRPNGAASEFTAQVSISYKVFYYNNNDRAILDSSTIRVEDVNPEKKEKELVGDVNIGLFNGSQYMIEIVARDINRNQQVKDFVFVDKSTRSSAQNFLIESVETGLPVFRNFLFKDEKVYLRHREIGKQSKLYVRYYHRDYPLALPPFSVQDQKPFDYKCDSLFTVNLDDSSRALVTLPMQGFYHFQTDTSRQDGITLFRFNEEFPQVSKADQLIHPLRYITSKQEYEEMLYNSNRKIALDNFWMSCTGSQDRARDAVRKYYSRVEDANNYFTSYVEGWKTDRGMIYLIFGPPNIIYKNNFSESWIYGEENNVMSLTFNFEKVYNPFTDNDYQLDRSAVYKTSWYRSVDIWREGRTYIEN